MKKKIISFCAVALFALSGSAFGLALTPADCTPGYPCWTGSETGMPKVYEEIAALVDGPEITIDSATEIYKQDAGGGESGNYAPFYSTSFSPNEEDASGATITFNGPLGSEMAGAEYLLVKDGNHLPAWYLFSISLWNGTDDIILTDFWPKGGAISHVSIYGASVPEPATLFLLGTALAGLAIFRRRGFNSEFTKGESLGIQPTTA